MSMILCRRMILLNYSSNVNRNSKNINNQCPLVSKLYDIVVKTYFKRSKK